MIFQCVGEGEGWGDGSHLSEPGKDKSKRNLNEVVVGRHGVRGSEYGPQEFRLCKRGLCEFWLRQFRLREFRSRGFSLRDDGFFEFRVWIFRNRRGASTVHPSTTLVLA